MGLNWEMWPGEKWTEITDIWVRRFVKKAYDTNGGDYGCFVAIFLDFITIARFIPFSCRIEPKEDPFPKDLLERYIYSWHAGEFEKSDFVSVHECRYESNVKNFYMRCIPSFRDKYDTDKAKKYLKERDQIFPILN